MLTPPTRLPAIFRRKLVRDRKSTHMGCSTLDRVPRSAGILCATVTNAPARVHNKLARTCGRLCYGLGLVGRIKSLRSASPHGRHPLQNLPHHHHSVRFQRTFLAVHLAYFECGGSPVESFRSYGLRIMFRGSEHSCVGRACEGKEERCRYRQRARQRRQRYQLEQGNQLPAA